MKSLMMRDW